jgi:hypothetical protein
MKTARARIDDCGLLHRVTFHAPSGARAGARPPKRYRGSARRLRQIRLRGTFAWEMWLLVAWVAFLVFGVLPWMMRHAP